MDSTKRWYAVYTQSRAEKKIAERLTLLKIENYLPLQKVLKQWSDRKKYINEPLFRSYIFVKVNNEEYLKVLNVPGTVGYVTIAHKKIAIPDYQIEAVKTYLGESIIYEPLYLLQNGDNVEIKYGPMKGLRGQLINCKNFNKLVILIDAINQVITITLPSHLLQKITALTNQYA